MARDLDAADVEQDGRAAAEPKAVTGTAAREGATDAGRRWRTFPADPGEPSYPGIGYHVWQAWPFLALEVDGYSGVHVYNPDGTNMYAFAVFNCGDHAASPSTSNDCGACAGRSIYDTLRATIDAMEAARFLEDRP